MIVLRRHKALRDAVFELRDRLAEADPQAVRDCRAFGCCGCGTWMADVMTPVGEAYCWRCVRRRRMTGYTVMDAS
jgi:hypothetical protein